MATTVSLKPNAVEISGSTSGTTTLQATAVAGTTTLTLPAATDTLVGKATTDTLTNKTLTGAAMNGTLGATTPSTGAFTTLSASGTLGVSSNVNVNSTGGTIGVYVGPSGSEASFVYNTDGNLYISPRSGFATSISGNLLVGATSGSTKMYVVDTSVSVSTARFFKNVASSQAVGALTIDKFDNTSTTAQIFVQFTINNQGTGSGQINANGASAAAFGSFSDSRLKENITELPSQLANIMALRPVEFDYIESEGGGHQIGFIAQEVKEIYPDLVGERADGMFTLTDMNKNDARLIKAIQEQQALIVSMREEIDALKTKVGT
jgi:hypothetical protein